MPSDQLFGPLFTTPTMREAVSDRAWLQAMLDAESALTASEAAVGLIPREAAEAIRAACNAERFDVAAIGEAAPEAANPVVPLVEALREAVPGEAAGYVHLGATSQDILDTAAMLVSRHAIGLLLDDLDAVAAACARLAQEHRDTVMAGRTLLQQAMPITFGLKAAGWLSATLDARERLADIRANGLAIQLGGAAGTLSVLGPQGPEVVAEMARALGLAEPLLPWHTARARVADIGAALTIAAGTMAKIALDVALLAQSEVGEVAEPDAPGRGRSSAMPQKRNPVASVAVAASARRVQALAGVLLGAMVQEHERAAGAWQAEWPVLTEAFELTAGATRRVREVLGELHVDAARMRANLDAGGGYAMAEQVTTVLAARIGPAEARALVQQVTGRGAEQGIPLRDALLGDAAVCAHLTEDDIDRALDPSSALGSTDVFIDRALAAYRRGR